MDKNSITGLVLMALVMFGFMWLSKPDAETARPDSHAVETAAPDAAASDGASAAAMPAEAGMAAAVTAAAHGTLPATYTDSYFSLAVDTLGHLSGTYTNGTDTVPVADLIAGTSALDPASKTLAAQRASALVANAGRYGGFAAFMGGADAPSVLENDVVRITLGSVGAMVKEVTLKKYTTQVGGDTTDIVLFHGDTDSYGFRFQTADQRIDTRSLTFRSRAEGDSAVYYYVAPADGAEWGIRYTLLPGSYVLRTEIVQKGMAAVLPASTSSMGFDWGQKMARNELGRTFEERNSAIYYKYIGEGVDDLSANGDESKNLNGRLRWVAFKNQFFSSVVIARDCFSGADVKSVEIKNDRYLKDMSMAATLPYTPADGTAAAFDFYFGPNDYPLLSSLDDTLDVGEDLSLTRLIPLGWGLFRWINTLIVIPVFTFLGSFISNYGIIILLLTIFIKLIIFPFTYKSFMSQAKMRVLAPEIKAINDKYPDAEDAMKRQQETMALYSRAGASPFSGCLPMLLQMPVLIAMFSFFPSAIELRGQGFLWAHDLSAPDAVLTLPFSIPFYGSHVSLFCLLMTAINIIYMRVSMQSQPQSASMPGMKMMQYLMPVMFLFIFNDYASGLSYYYLLSLLITIIQTYIFRKVVDEKKVREQLLANARKPRKKSGWMARLEEAQRQAQAAQRQQQNNPKRRR